MKQAQQELSFTLLLHMGLTVQEPALYSFYGRPLGVWREKCFIPFGQALGNTVLTFSPSSSYRMSRNIETRSNISVQDSS